MWAPGRTTKEVVDGASRCQEDKERQGEQESQAAEKGRSLQNFPLQVIG